MQWIEIHTSWKPGPTTLISVFVHGNEIVGDSIIQHIVKKIETEPYKSLHKGTVILLYANPEAQKRWTRFVDEDLNRSFGHDANPEHYETKRAKEIIEFLQNNSQLTINQVFDFHSTATESDPMIICSENPESIEMAAMLPIKTIVSWLFWFLKWKSLTSYLVDRWIIDIAIECGWHNSPKTLLFGREIADIVLDIHNWMSKPAEIDKEIIKITDLLTTSSPDFEFDIDLKWFERLAAWTTIWHDAQQKYVLEKDTVVVLPGTNKLIQKTASLRGSSPIFFIWEYK